MKNISKFLFFISLSMFTVFAADAARGTVHSLPIEKGSPYITPCDKNPTCLSDLSGN